MVKVGCKLPKGFTIEYGTPGEPGYGFVNLAGGSDKKPGITPVGTVVWTTWKRANAKLRYVMDGSIFEAK